MTPEKLLSRISRLEKNGSSERPGGVLMIEIDRFRQLRTRMGYRTIFGLVSQVRKALDACLDKRGEIHRFGLSGFLVIMPEMEASQLQATAEELFTHLSRSVFELQGNSVAISSSMTLARFDHRFVGGDRLVVALAARIEEVMADGGNELAFVEPGVSVSQARDSDDYMLGLLMEALRGNRMRVVFQPLLATGDDGGVQSFQMLPRLQAVDGQLIAAAEFIPVARESRLLPVLDRWMVTHAVKLLEGPMNSRSIRLFLNQSDALLVEAERLDWLLDKLERFDGGQGGLVIEVRIEDAMAHLSQVERLIAGAREHGSAVCLSMVDEHSRWDLLTDRLACDYLRMAPAFVARLVNQPDLEKRFLELNEPVKALGTRVIMPMIEDQETASRMWRSGADFMQGNMIQEPEESIVLEE